jgi:hypothetical protein
MSDKGFLEDFAVGAVIGVLLIKVPWLRWVAAVVAAGFGAIWFMAAFVDGGVNPLCLVFAAGCFGIAAMFVRWSREPARHAQTAANNYAILQTPEGIARLMQDSTVNVGADGGLDDPGGGC